MLPLLLYFFGFFFIGFFLADAATRGVLWKKPKACKFIKKETLTQVFSCEFSEISKNVFLQSTYRPQACNFIKKETLVQVFSCEFCKIFKKTFSTNTSKRLLLFETMLQRCILEPNNLMFTKDSILDYVLNKYTSVLGLYIVQFGTL